MAFYRLGILERSEKNYDQALTYLNHALDIDPDLMDVFSAVITVYALQQKFEPAMARRDEHLAARGEDPRVAAVILNLKANILLADNQLETAVETYEKAILKNPAYVIPYLNLGKIFTAQGRIQDAIQTYTDLIENRPDQSSAHTLLGTLYENKGQFDLAETHYKTALEIDPDLIPALNNLAYLYAEQEIHLNQALDMARQARRQTQQVPPLSWIHWDGFILERPFTTVRSWNLPPRLDWIRPILYFSTTWDLPIMNLDDPKTQKPHWKTRYAFNPILQALKQPEPFWPSFDTSHSAQFSDETPRARPHPLRT